jgi:hypothetical protein
MHFPLFNTLRHTRLCMAALTLGLGIHLPSQAQNGTLVAAGQISTTTCVVVFRDFGTTNAIPNSKSFALGSLLRSGLPTTKGATLGSPVGAGFGLSAPSGSGNCTGSATVFDASIQLRPEQIVTMTGTSLGTETFLKNSLSTADGGTDAVVLLKGGFSATAPENNNINAAGNALTLKPNTGLTGNYISGSNTTPGSNTTWKYLTATLVNSATNNPPSPGRFVQTIQLLAVYN